MRTAARVHARSRACAWRWPAAPLQRRKSALRHPIERAQVAVEAPCDALGVVVFMPLDRHRGRHLDGRYPLVIFGVEVAPERRGDALRRPIDHRLGEDAVTRDSSLEHLGLSRRRIPPLHELLHELLHKLLHKPRQQSGRRVVQPSGESVGTGSLDMAVRTVRPAARREPIEERASRRVFHAGTLLVGAEVGMRGEDAVHVIGVRRRDQIAHVRRDVFAVREIPLIAELFGHQRMHQPGHDGLCHGAVVCGRERESRPLRARSPVERAPRIDQVTKVCRIHARLGAARRVGEQP